MMTLSPQCHACTYISCLHKRRRLLGCLGHLYFNGLTDSPDASIQPKNFTADQLFMYALANY